MRHERGRIADVPVVVVGLGRVRRALRRNKLAKGRWAMSEKIVITFKDPDGVYESLREHVDDSLGVTEDLLPSERKRLVQERVSELGKKLSKWVEYGEYITVEFDLKAETATVK